MLGLTVLGVLHTAISLVALVSDPSALAKYRQISPSKRAGQVYLVTTFVTAITALGIFQHGRFGPPHALAIMTLAALATGSVAATTQLFGPWSHFGRFATVAETAAEARRAPPAAHD